MASKEERSDRKRRAILAAARGLFVKDGYAGAGMEAVARVATISTATLYAYFPSKADLFRAVVDDVLDAVPDAPVAADRAGDARERLSGFALDYAAFMTDPLHRALYRLVAAERRQFADLADRADRTARAHLGGTLIRIIQGLASAGELIVERPSAAAGQLLGMIEHATLVVAMIHGDETRPARRLETICEDAVETFLARYGAR